MRNNMEEFTFPSNDELKLTATRGGHDELSEPAILITRVALMEFLKEIFGECTVIGSHFFRTTITLNDVLEVGDNICKRRSYRLGGFAGFQLEVASSIRNEENIITAEASSDTDYISSESESSISIESFDDSNKSSISGSDNDINSNCSSDESLEIICCDPQSDITRENNFERLFDSLQSTTTSSTETITVTNNKTDEELYSISFKSIIYMIKYIRDTVPNMLYDITTPALKALHAFIDSQAQISFQSTAPGNTSDCLLKGSYLNMRLPLGAINLLIMHSIEENKKWNEKYQLIEREFNLIKTLQTEQEQADELIDALKLLITQNKPPSQPNPTQSEEFRAMKRELQETRNQLEDKTTKISLLESKFEHIKSLAKHLGELTDFSTSSPEKSLKRTRVDSNMLTSSKSISTPTSPSNSNENDPNPNAIDLDRLVPEKTWPATPSL